MKFEKIRLTVKTENGYNGAIKFEGIPLGRSVGNMVKRYIYSEGTEIYQLKDGGFLIYLFRRNYEREKQFADFVRTEKLDFDEIRHALKVAGIYPGPCFAEALYHSFGVMERIRKLGE
ncbi:MAG: hypothetical protein ACOC86_03920 [Candidatus Bipolaricaulota bacterium]